jgi:hypothetical protein
MQNAMQKLHTTGKEKPAPKEKPVDKKPEEKKAEEKKSEAKKPEPAPEPVSEKKGLFGSIFGRKK